VVDFAKLATNFSDIFAYKSDILSIHSEKNNIRLYSWAGLLNGFRFYKMQHFIV
jgi:hypothetical protein